MSLRNEYTVNCDKLCKRKKIFTQTMYLITNMSPLGDMHITKMK